MKKYLPEYIIAILLSFFLFQNTYAANDISQLNNNVDREESTISDNAKISYDLYHERYTEYSISGFSSEILMSTPIKNLWPYFMYGARVGSVESKNPVQKKHAGFGSVVMGAGVSYGYRLKVYAEAAFDLGEFVIDSLLDSVAEDKENPTEFIDLDTYFASGLGLQFNKYFSLSVYGKINHLTGGVVRNNTSLYYGLKMSFFYR